jgi:hypothetical protein
MPYDAFGNYQPRIRPAATAAPASPADSPAPAPRPAPRVLPIRPAPRPYVAPRRNSWEESPAVRGRAAGRVGDASITFGVELEISTATAYQDLDGKTAFGCKSDCSVHGDGREFVSPVLSGDEGLQAVENLLAYAAANRWRADNSCGYHLHLGMQNYTNAQQRNLYLAYKLTERVWRNLVAEQRSRNSYCRSIPHRARDIRSSSDIYNMIVDRYEWINISALESHTTFEVRLHQGTVDRDEVINWIIAHVRFVSAVMAMTERQVTRKFADISVAKRFVRLERLWGIPELGNFYRAKAAGRIPGLRAKAKAWRGGKTLPAAPAVSVAAVLS